MSISVGINGAADVRVIAGEELVLRVAAYDPNGISKIFVQVLSIQHSQFPEAEAGYR